MSSRDHDVEILTKEFKKRSLETSRNFWDLWRKKYEHGDLSINEYDAMSVRLDDLSMLMDSYMDSRRGREQPVDEDGDDENVEIVASNSEVESTLPPSSAPAGLKSAERTPQNPVQRRARFLQKYGKSNASCSDSSSECADLLSDSSIYPGRAGPSESFEKNNAKIRKSADGKGVKGKKSIAANHRDDCPSTVENPEIPNRRKGIKKMSFPLSTDKKKMEAASSKRLSPALTTDSEAYARSQSRASNTRASTNMKLRSSSPDSSMMPPPVFASGSRTHIPNELKNLAMPCVTMMFTSPPLPNKSSAPRQTNQNSKERRPASTSRLLSNGNRPESASGLVSNRASSGSRLALTSLVDYSDTEASDSLSLKSPEISTVSRSRPRRRKGLIPLSLRKPTVKTTRTESKTSSSTKKTKQTVTETENDQERVTHVATLTEVVDKNRGKISKKLSLAKTRQAESCEEQYVTETEHETEEDVNRRTSTTKSMIGGMVSNREGFSAQLALNSDRRSDDASEDTVTRQVTSKRMAVEHKGSKTNVRIKETQSFARFEPDVLIHTQENNNLKIGHSSKAVELPAVDSLAYNQEIGCKNSKNPPKGVKFTKRGSSQNLQNTLAPISSSLRSEDGQKASKKKTSVEVAHSTPNLTRTVDVSTRRSRELNDLDLSVIIPDIPSMDNSNLSSDRRVTRSIQKSSPAGSSSALAQRAHGAPVKPGRSKIVKTVETIHSDDNIKIIEKRTVVQHLSDTLNTTNESIIPAEELESQCRRSRSGRLLSPRKMNCLSCSDCSQANSSLKTTSGLWRVSPKSSPEKTQKDTTSPNGGLLRTERTSTETAISHDGDLGVVSVTQKTRTVRKAMRVDGSTRSPVQMELRRLALSNSALDVSMMSTSGGRVTRSSLSRSPARSRSLSSTQNSSINRSSSTSSVYPRDTSNQSFCSTSVNSTLQQPSAGKRSSTGGGSGTQFKRAMSLNLSGKKRISLESAVTASTPDEKTGESSRIFHEDLSPVEGLSDVSIAAPLSKTSHPATSVPILSDSKAGRINKKEGTHIPEKTKGNAQKEDQEGNVPKAQKDYLRKPISQENSRGLKGNAHAKLSTTKISNKGKSDGQNESKLPSMSHDTEKNAPKTQQNIQEKIQPPPNAQPAASNPASSVQNLMQNSFVTAIFNAARSLLTASGVNLDFFDSAVAQALPNAPSPLPSNVLPATSLIPPHTPSTLPAGYPPAPVFPQFPVQQPGYFQMPLFFPLPYQPAQECSVSSGVNNFPHFVNHPVQNSTMAGPTLDAQDTTHSVRPETTTQVESVPKLKNGRRSKDSSESTLPKSLGSESANVTGSSVDSYSDELLVQPKKRKLKNGKMVAGDPSSSSNSSFFLRSEPDRIVLRSAEGKNDEVQGRTEVVTVVKGSRLPFDSLANKSSNLSSIRPSSIKHRSSAPKSLKHQKSSSKGKMRSRSSVGKSSEHGEKFELEQRHKDSSSKFDDEKRKSYERRRVSPSLSRSSFPNADQEEGEPSCRHGDPPRDFRNKEKSFHRSKSGSRGVDKSPSPARRSFDKKAQAKPCSKSRSSLNKKEDDSDAKDIDASTMNEDYQTVAAEQTESAKQKDESFLSPKIAAAIAHFRQPLQFTTREVDSDQLHKPEISVERSRGHIKLKDVHASLVGDANADESISSPVLGSKGKLAYGTKKGQNGSKKVRKSVSSDNEENESP